jgi:hypothetical protein
MRKKMGIEAGPLSGAEGRVSSKCFLNQKICLRIFPFTDHQVTLYVPVLPQGCLDPLHHPGREDGELYVIMF